MATDKQIAYIGLGSNQGDRLANINKAITAIEIKIGPIILQSYDYETAAWGKENQYDFLNKVIAVESSMAPMNLLNTLHEIENILGRIREEKWGPRCIDLDILMYGDHIIDEENLKIPHPHMQDRNFVLVPLMEIASDVVHPVFRKTMEELYIDCRDHCEIILID